MAGAPRPGERGHAPGDGALEWSRPTKEGNRDTFWAAHLRLGFLIFIGESLATIAYVWLRPRSPDAWLLTWIALAGAGTGGATLALLPAIARRSWRSTFSIAWSLLAGAILAVCANVDGGVDSPLVLLIVLPLAYASLAYEPRGVVVCGAAAAVQMTFVVLTDPDIDQPWKHLLVLAAAVLGLAAMAVAASINRQRLEREEQDLSTLLEEAATHDDLTGCLNHRAFSRALAYEVERARRYKQPLCLVVADLDDFKSINDRLGHPAGDQVLAMAGRALRENVRSLDIAGRIGGDEFAVLLPGSGAAAAGAQVDRLRRAMDAAHPALRGVSVGWAGLDDLGDGDRLFAEADARMYRDKAARKPSAPGARSAAPSA